jgi:hypothetical protein
VVSENFNYFWNVEVGGMSKKIAIVDVLEVTSQIRSDGEPSIVEKY